MKESRWPTPKGKAVLCWQVYTFCTYDTLLYCQVNISLITRTHFCSLSFFHVIWSCCLLVLRAGAEARCLFITPYNQQTY